MDLDKLQSNLLMAARANRPSDQVPYGFEQRIMARLRQHSVLDHAAFWAHALWRAAAPCVVLMLFLILWAAVHPASSSASSDLSLDLENTLLTVADQEPSPPAEFFW